MVPQDRQPPVSEAPEVGLDHAAQGLGDVQARRGASGRMPTRGLRLAVTAVRWTLMSCAVAAICLSIVGMLANYQVVAVTSGSMRPGIEPGDALLVRETGDKGVRVGDIVVFKAPGAKTMIAHRIIEARDFGGTKQYRMKGDANTTVDANLVPSRAVFGKVTVRIPAIGRQLYWFSQVGIKLALAVLFGLIFIEELCVLIPFLRRRGARRRAASTTHAQDGRR
jgi:signal peptidase